MTVDDLLAYEAIRRTIHAYNLSGDRGRLADLAATFCENGELHTPHGGYTGRAAIAQGLQRGGDPQSVQPKFVRHNLTTSRIDLTGPRSAEGRHYFVVLTEIGVDRAGVYKDVYEKVGEDWLIRRRDVRLDYVAENTRMLRPPAAADAGA
ncbi:MAG: hypothetical protein JWQ97_3299 [Phenylobacterium sp.]|nr:hypothetical protein [Phenylobacterium sp.]